MENEVLILPNINLGFGVIEKDIKEGTPIELKNLLRNPNNLNIRNGFNHTPLMISSKFGSCEKTKSILDCGADPDLYDKDGNTALMISARYDRGDIIKILLDAKAKINLKNYLGQTALDIANDYNSEYAISSLTKRSSVSNSKFKILSMY
jgi:ankyrin repeat protein